MELEGEAREAFVRERREEFQKDIDVLPARLGDAGRRRGSPSELRGELIKRLGYASTKQHRFPPRRNGVYPV
jgi:hypothetical protein